MAYIVIAVVLLLLAVLLVVALVQLYWPWLLAAAGLWLGIELWRRKRGHSGVIQQSASEDVPGVPRFYLREIVEVPGELKGYWFAVGNRFGSLSRVAPGC